MLAVFAEGACPYVAVVSVTEFYLHRKRTDGRVVWACLKQKDAHGWVFGESAGDYCACGACADNDVVVDHFHLWLFRAARTDGLILSRPV